MLIIKNEISFLFLLSVSHIHNKIKETLAGLSQKPSFFKTDIDYHKQKFFCRCKDSKLHLPEDRLGFADEKA